MDTAQLVVLLVLVPTLVLGAFAAVFLICRAIVLWYWKIDRLVALLEVIAANTHALEERGRPLLPPAAASTLPTVPAAPSLRERALERFDRVVLGASGD